MTRPVLVALLVSLALAVPSAAGGVRSAADPAAGSYIVVFEPTAVRAAGEARAQRPLGADSAVGLARAHGGNVTHVYQHALKGFSVRVTAAQADALAAYPRVAYVEPDQVMHAVATQSP